MKWYRMIAAGLSLALLAGCAGGVTAGTPQSLYQEETAPVSPAPDTQAGQALAELGPLLLRQVREEGKNTLISPLSVLLALSMTANGAEGETLATLLDTLAGGVDLETLNGNCASLLAEYAALGGSTQCNIANSLWLDGGLEAAPDFLGRCGGAYGAGLYQADLDAVETVEAVNAWVKEQTKGMIGGILSEPLAPETVLLLVNAVYLKNTWEREFDPICTWENQDFHLADGDTVPVDLMSNGIRTERYFSTGEEAGVVLPYDDGRLAFVALLPSEGTTLTGYLDTLDGAKLQNLVAGAEDTRLLLRLPRFQAEWEGSLNAALRALGLEVAFDPARADFSGMGTADGPLYIGQVLHKARIEVNEQGTEAAAVTAVAIPAGADGPPDPYRELTLDRPFVYGIVDLERGVPLFLGTLEAPEQDG